MTVPGPVYRFHVHVAAFIPYSFVCEYCGESSGEMEYRVCSDEVGTMNSGGAGSAEHLAKRVVDAKLPSALKRLSRRLKRGYCPFDPTCPHCQKKQSWELGQDVLAAGELALKYDVLLVSAAVLLYCFVPRCNIVLLAAAALAACIILTAVYMLPPWRRFRKAGIPQMPTVEWGSIRYSTHSTSC